MDGYRFVVRTLNIVKDSEKTFISVYGFAQGKNFSSRCRHFSWLFPMAAIQISEFYTLSIFFFFLSVKSRRILLSAFHNIEETKRQLVKKSTRNQRCSGRIKLSEVMKLLEIFHFVFPLCLVLECDIVVLMLSRTNESSLFFPS